MADATTRPGSDDLQFDRAIDAGAESPGHPVCAKCQAPIRMYYYHVNGETACSTCKATMDRAGGGGGGPKAGMAKAILFGLGAALAGAFIYYAVMKYLELEIGYVAILIGFMVGYAVRHAVSNRGSRRFQLLAAGLTYLAVALAYAPFAMGASDDDEPEVAAVEGSLQPISDAPPAGETMLAAADDAGANGASTVDPDVTDSVIADSTIVEPQALGAAGFAIGLAGILLLVLALPVIVILGSMPSGLISALIIAIGMRQAWTMTGGDALSVTGPFKVGSQPPPAPAQA